MTLNTLSEIEAECQRQMESCLYTSTTLYIWLRTVRFARFGSVLVPLLLSGVAALGLTKFNFPAYVVVLLTFAASLFPALQHALKIETSIERIASEASRYKSLQDRFRQVSKIGISQGKETALREFHAAMEDLNLARLTSITPPERYFRKAQAKIARGDYSFSVDAQPQHLS